MQKIVISICIVSYKAENTLKKCLKAVYASNIKVPFEVIVVDNDPENDNLLKILKSYPKVNYIKASKNGGYGAGNNIGISNSKGEYIFILNPDALVSKDTINVLYKFLRNNLKAGGVGSSLQTKSKGKMSSVGSGELTPLVALFSMSFIHKLFPNNSISKSYYLDKDNRNMEKEVWAIPGSCGMFRKDALTEVGNYDENLFLYFEENDLGRRLKKSGWQLWINPKTEIIHLIGESTKTRDENFIKAVFISSRFYYFKKHFGIFKALLVEAVSRFGKYEALALGVLLLGTFLRIYRLQENMVFHGELGDNYLAMKNILTTGVIPLLGPPTSHPWLSFGPLFYWIFTPILLILQFSPIGMSYLFALISSFVIALNYWTIFRLFSKNIALISSFIISISPIYLWFTRESRFFSLTLLFFYPFLYFLLKKKYILTGLFLGILLNFHLTPLIYIPPLILYLWFTEKKKFLKTISSFTSGLIVPQIPFLISNILSGGKMLIQVLEWIPYRILGFLGIIQRNNLNTENVVNTSKSLISFVSNIFIPTDSTILSFGIIFFVIALVYFRLKKKIDNNLILLSSLLFFGYIAIFIHGNPPIHYFLPLLPPFILLISCLISSLDLKIKNVIYILIFLFALNTFKYYFSTEWFYIDQSKYLEKIPVPYNLQLSATKAISVDAANYPFSLKRVGRYDQFDKNYSQNYIYLLWKNGNEPIDNQILKYNLYENVAPSNNSETIIFNKGGIIVTR